MPLKFLNILSAFIILSASQLANADYVPRIFYKSAHPVSCFDLNREYTSVQQVADYQLQQLNSCAGMPAASKPYTISNIFNFSIQYKPANSTTTLTYSADRYTQCGTLPPVYSPTSIPTCSGTQPPNECEPLAGIKIEYSSAENAPETECLNGCFVSMIDQICTSGVTMINGKNLPCLTLGKYTGKSCSVPQGSGASAPPDSPAYNCIKNGQGVGTVNGAVVCVPKNSTGSQPYTNKTAGTSTTTQAAPTPGNPTPSPVTTQSPSVSVTVTPPPAGSPSGTQPTVSETKTNSDGSKTTQEGQKDDFCSQNPNSKLCQLKSSCEQNPDGPGCKHLCEKYPDSVGCKKSDDFIDNLTDSIKENIIGTEDDIPNESLEEKEITIGDNTNFDTVQINSDTSCPSPRTMTIAGATMEVSFEWLCQYASAFRMLVRALATFFAFQIIAAAIRGDAQPHQRSLF